MHLRFYRSKVRVAGVLQNVSIQSQASVGWSQNTASRAGCFPSMQLTWVPPLAPYGPLSLPLSTPRYDPKKQTKPAFGYAVALITSLFRSGRLPVVKKRDAL